MVSVRYRLLNGPSVPVSSLSPTLLLLNLNTGMDSGGSLVVNLLLNKVLMGGIVSPGQGLCPLGRACVPWAGFVSPRQGLSLMPQELWVPVGLFLFFLLLQNTLSLF